MFTLTLKKATKEKHSEKQNQLKEHSDKKYKILEKVISLIDKIKSIIMKTWIRPGKEFYAKKNNTYGLCSLRTKHISFKDDKKQIILKFVGKKIFNINIK